MRPVAAIGELLPPGNACQGLRTEGPAERENEA